MRSRIARFAMRQRATAAVAVILVVVMAGTTLAASRGNAWRLGYVETLSAYVTGITGIHTAELLRVANTNTSSGARAIRAESRSAAAGTIYAKNSGGGPAAEFVTNAGKAPFKVNRTTRVVNLNADYVDGVTSANLLPGGTLRTGATIRGAYAVSADQSASWAFEGQSFGYTLPSAPLPVFIPAGGTPPATCPGTVSNPQALVGYLCIYEQYNQGHDAFTCVVNVLTGGCGSTSRFGFGIAIYPAGAADFVSWGTWAATSGTAVTTSSPSGGRHATEPR